MAHTYSSLLFHLIWSTREREPMITADFKPRLYAYMETLFEDEGAHVVIMNGMPDHVHILVHTKPSILLSTLVRKVKGASCRWTHQNISELEHFGWQDGYGAFSVGYSNKEAVYRYIQNQEEHHRQSTYDAEFTRLLEMQKIQYDPRFVLG